MSDRIGVGSAPVHEPPVAPVPDKTKKQRNARVSHCGSGRPRKVSSRYLMENVRHLDNLCDFEHLFPGYCHVYEDNEGHLPANPRASFIEAVQSCAERILHERGQT